MAATIFASRWINAENLLEHLQGGEFLESWLQAYSADESSDNGHLLAFGTVAEQSVMPDSDESLGQHMHEETPDELFGMKGQGGVCPCPVVLDLEADRFGTNVEDSGIGDGDAVGIPSEVLDDIGSTLESLLDVGNPFLGVEGGEEIVEHPGIAKHLEIRRKIEFFLLIEYLQAMEKFPPEESGNDFDGEKEVAFGGDEALFLA